MASSVVADLDGEEDIELSDGVGSSHSSQRRRLDEEIESRTAIFRKSAFLKCELRLNLTPQRERSEIGSRDGSKNGGGRVRQSSFSFRKRAASVSDVNRSDVGAEESRS